MSDAPDRTEVDAVRRRVLAALGAAPDVVEELFAYGASAFDPAGAAGATFPRDDEPQLAAWEAYAQAARRDGVVPALARRLVQLRFPIAAGRAREEAYRDVTLRGRDPDEVPGATGLELVDPEGIELTLHPTPAGRIPVLTARHRADFVALVRALSGRNEPIHVPDAMGACTVAGLNDWDRIRAHRRRWAASAADASDDAWDEERARLFADKPRYQDRILLLSSGPYGGVPAAAVGVDEVAWRALSIAIRREHECAHYFTKRVFGSMRDRWLDETIADYAGIGVATGRFRLDWFLTFAGLEDFPRYRRGARLEHYVGEPPLSPAAFAVLGALVRAAATALAAFDDATRPDLSSTGPRARVLAGLCRLTLEEMAAPDGVARLVAAVGRG